MGSHTKIILKHIALLIYTVLAVSSTSNTRNVRCSPGAPGMLVRAYTRSRTLTTILPVNRGWNLPNDSENEQWIKQWSSSESMRRQRFIQENNCSSLKSHEDKMNYNLQIAKKTFDAAKAVSDFAKEIFAPDHAKNFNSKENRLFKSISKFMSLASPTFAILSSVFAFFEPETNMALINRMSNEFDKVNNNLDNLRIKVDRIEVLLEKQSINEEYLRQKHALESTWNTFTRFLKVPHNGSLEDAKKYCGDPSTSPERVADWYYYRIVKTGKSPGFLPFPETLLLITDFDLAYLHRWSVTIMKDLSESLYLMSGCMSLNEAWSLPHRQIKISEYEKKVLEIGAALDAMIIKASWLFTLEQLEVDVKKWTTGKHTLDNEALSKIIHDNLKRKYFWIQWAVLVYDYNDKLWFIQFARVDFRLKISQKEIILIWRTHDDKKEIEAAQKIKSTLVKINYSKRDGFNGPDGLNYYWMRDHYEISVNRHRWCEWLLEKAGVYAQQLITIGSCPKLTTVAINGQYIAGNLVYFDEQINLKNSTRKKEEVCL